MRLDAPAPTKRAFGAYWDQWLDTYAREHCKASTLAGYELVGRLYLKPTFGARDLTEIRREDVKTLAYDRLAGKLPPLPAAAPDASERRRPRA
ncbi:MAG: hypothetical protein ABI629_01620 [bacterium]